mmetsp:Transcript_6469/g.16345  ORF Transcript_6469/g.16345 Transcript_6469/m.16345 type:complete len:240 (+) Transcript_6469:280-999(+)
MRSSWHSEKQTVHHRTGSLLPSSARLCGEQLLHTRRPHLRQWCLRLNSVNSPLQMTQLEDMESGVHTGASAPPALFVPRMVDCFFFHPSAVAEITSIHSVFSCAVRPKTTNDFLLLQMRKACVSGLDPPWSGSSSTRVVSSGITWCTVQRLPSDASSAYTSRSLKRKKYLSLRALRQTLVSMPSFTCRRCASTSRRPELPADKFCEISKIFCRFSARRISSLISVATIIILSSDFSRSL